jgi:RIO-like serine/threonine protein kinase
MQLFKAAGTFQCLGFVHDDMHLHNVKIDDDDHLVIIDFDRMRSIADYVETDKISMWYLLEQILTFGDIEWEYKRCLMKHLQRMLDLEKGVPRYCNLFDSDQLTVERIFQNNTCSQ